MHSVCTGYYVCIQCRAYSMLELYLYMSQARYDCSARLDSEYLKYFLRVRCGNRLARICLE